MRRKLGYSQSKLAQVSQVSLPTIQNIEAGKANPTMEVVEKLLHALGLEITISPCRFDAEKAIKLGVPLSGSSSVKANQKQLIAETKKWVHLITNQKLSQRERDAIIAFLMAIKDHYSKFFKSEISCSVFEKEIEYSRNDGKIIKLRRIALANLGKYL